MPTSKPPAQGLQTLPDKRGIIKNCTKGKSYPCGKACLGVGSAILGQCMQGMKATASQKATKLAKSLLKKAGSGSGSGSSGNDSDNGSDKSNSVAEKAKGLGVGTGIGNGDPIVMPPKPTVPDPALPTAETKLNLLKQPSMDDYDPSNDDEAEQYEKDIIAVNKANLKTLVEYGQKEIEKIQSTLQAAKDGMSIAEKLYQQARDDTQKLKISLSEMIIKEKAYIAVKEQYEKQLESVFNDYRQNLFNTDTSKEEADFFAKKMVKYGSKLSVGFNNSAYGKAELQRDVAEMYQLSNGAIAMTVKKIDYKNKRAWASKNGSVSVNMGIVRPKEGSSVAEEDKKRTMYHELGHHVEFSSSPEVQEVIQTWLKERSTGKPQKLKDLLSNPKYPDEEIAYPDKFISPYTGRVYDDGLGNPERGSSEVFSMGIQHFAYPKDMVKLLEKDPEHFALTLGILKTARDSAAIV